MQTINKESLPLYQCHKVVKAARIMAISMPSHHGDSIRLLLDPEPVLRMPPINDADATVPTASRGYVEITVSRDYLEFRRPKRGGFYVLYEDGYESFSPAKPFADGYSRYATAVDGTDLLNIEDMSFSTRRVDYNNSFEIFSEGLATDKGESYRVSCLLGRIPKANMPALIASLAQALADDKA